MNLCQPELQLDAESINARLTRLEDQIRSGAITVRQAAPEEAPFDDDRPPMPDDDDAPPSAEEEAPRPVVSEAPASFWADLAQQVRRELKPPVSGFFVSTPNAPIQGVLQGDRLLLVCSNDFTMEIVNKPEILQTVSRKASAMQGRPIRAVVTDRSGSCERSSRMEELLKFGKAHSDIVTIKE